MVTIEQPAKGSKRGGLGIVVSIAARSQSEPEFKRLLRFAMQRAASEIMPLSGVSKCLRRPVKNALSIDIRKKSNGKAMFGNLQTCKSLWLCAICQSRISELRRQEIKAILTVAKQRGYTVGFHTYTIRHGKKTPLAVSLKALKEARRWVASHKSAKTLKTRYGYIGAICATEITYGNNGFHPHHHELMIFSEPITNDDITFISGEFERLWHKGLEAQNATAKLGIGFVASYDQRDIASYITKLGEEKHTTWGFAEELAKGQSKTGKGDSFTPSDLLISYLMTGSKQDRELWREYAIATFGLNAIVFTPKLRAQFGLDEKSDGDLLQEEEVTALALYSIPLEVWRKILWKDRYGQLRADLLTAAEEGGPPEINMLLYEHGII